MRLAFILFLAVGLGIATVKCSNDASSNSISFSVDIDTAKIADPDIEGLKQHTKDSLEGITTWIEENDPSND